MPMRTYWFVDHVFWKASVATVGPAGPEPTGWLYLPKRKYRATKNPITTMSAVCQRMWYQRKGRFVFMRVVRSKQVPQEEEGIEQHAGRHALDDRARCHLRDFFNIQRAR